MRELGATVREERLINARSRYDAAMREANAPTVRVLGRRKTDNMPSLTRMLEILKPREGDATPGMDATVSSSVRISDRRACDPVMGCPMGGACVADPIDQAKVDQCPEC